jgi:uncharacterized protein YkwD
VSRTHTNPLHVKWSRSRADSRHVKRFLARVFAVALFVVALSHPELNAAALGVEPTASTGVAGVSASADQISRDTANDPSVTSDEAAIAVLINTSRREVGLASLVIEPKLADFARHHAVEMAQQGDVFHSVRDARVAVAPAGWALLGENVGMGPSADWLHTAFMHSTGHRANILGDFTHVSVGAVRGPDRRMYVTVVFVKLAELEVQRLAMADPAGGR